MANYSADQIADAMRQAGFPEAEIPTGVAVALTESSGDSGATNRGTQRVPEYSVGPWQINLNAHGRAITEPAARDLQSATNYAYGLWKAHGWQPWSVYTSGSYKANLQNGLAAEAGGVQEQQAVSADRITQLVQQHGPYTAVKKPGTEKVVPEGYPNTPRMREIVGMENPDPIWEVVFADGTKVDVRGERDAAGNPTGGWIPTGGDTGALKPPPTGKPPAGAPAGGVWVDIGDGRRVRMQQDPTTGSLIPATTPDGNPIVDQGGKTLPRGRTQAQEDASAAAAAASIAAAGLSIARAGQVGKPTPLDPVTQALREAQTHRADVEAAADAQRMLPAQLRVIQQGLQTLDYIRDEAAAGRLKPEEVDSYLTSVQQYVEAGLRGSTPAAEEKARQEQVTRRADIGKDILNRRVQSGTELAGNLFRDYKSLLTPTAEGGGTVSPGGFNPLTYARALTSELGGGSEMSDLAKALLAATNPATGPAVGPRISELAAAGGGNVDAELAAYDAALNLEAQPAA